TVANTGDEADRLIAARTDFAQDGVFQAAILAADGSVAVQDVPSIQVGAGQSLTFQPGGIRIVLNDVQRHLVAGAHFDMELEFEIAGTLSIEVEIEAHEDHDHPHDPSV